MTTESEKDEQKRFVRDVIDATGLTPAQIASKLGRGESTVKKYLWGDINLPANIRAELQRLRTQYSKGRPIMGVAEEPPDSKQGIIGGARGAVRSARERRGLSIEQLAKLTRHSASTLRRLEEGTLPHAHDDLIAALKRELPELEDVNLKDSDSPEIFSETGTEATVGAKPNLVLPPGMKASFVPLLSYAQAGAWDADHSDDIYDYTCIIALNLDDRRGFALTVLGNSMDPALQEGDMVVCSPSKAPNNGEAAVVRTRSGQIYIKYWQRKGNRVVLESANPDYKPIELPAEDVAGAWLIVQQVKKGAILKQN